TPCSSANSPTGDRTSLRPRPVGASGRVTTAATSCCSAASDARNAGTAACGVPANTRRISVTSEQSMGTLLERWPGIVEPTRRLDPPERSTPSVPVQVVDEQHATQVVDLVLDAPRE